MARVERWTRREDVLDGIGLWNDQHPDFHVDERFVDRSGSAPVDEITSTAWGVREAGEPIGFALVKRLTAEIPDYAGSDAGWLSLFAVDADSDEHARLGAELLSVVEGALADRGVTSVSVGKDPQHVLAGLPKPLVDRYGPLFESAGYDAGGTVVDVARDITTYERPDRVTGPMSDRDLTFRPIDPGETKDLLDFLADQFPGRWRFEADVARRIPGGVRDYWGAWKGGELIAFARTSRSDGPVPRSHLVWGSQFSERCCALGPIGVHEDERGNGYGLALISGAIESLRDKGYTHMIIDWTTKVDYYAKLGFEPFVEYVAFEKVL